MIGINVTFYILQKGLFRNLTSVSNVCEAAPISVAWEPNGLNELPEIRFGISFHPDWQIENGLFTRPIMTRTQILVPRLGPRTRISALYPRRS